MLCTQISPYGSLGVSAGEGAGGIKSSLAQPNCGVVGALVQHCVGRQLGGCAARLEGSSERRASCSFIRTDGINICLQR